MKNALLVVDMQNDFLWEGRDKKRFCYQNIHGLVQATNQEIAWCSQAGYDIIYIAQVLPNKFFYQKMFGFGLKGTEGVKLLPDIQVVSDFYFEKAMPDAFSVKALQQFVKDRGIEKVRICGIDEGGCVSATAQGAIKMGLAVEMATKAMDTAFPIAKSEKWRKKLKNQGVQYLD